MKLFRFVALTVVAGSFGIAGLHAQSSDTTTAPAETPPATFAGNQYVDSQGCVFNRAGVSDDVTWVPRVGRDRKQICGFQPSAGIVTTAPLPAPQAEPKPEVQVAADAAPSIETDTTAALTSSQMPKTVASAPTVHKPARRNKSMIMKTDPSLVILASGKSKWSNGRTTEAQNGQTGEIILVPWGTRVVPRHVYDNRRSATRFKVPRGYSTVWEDDRLNPRRVEQTLEGHARMNLIWTKTVPRRLIDATTGQDMTDTIPVIYPYTDVATQQRALAVSSKGTSRTSGNAPIEPNVSTKSQATEIKRESVVGQNYVQVGTFDDARTAQASAQKIKKMGLPVRIGKYARDGKTYRLVLAGPFSSDDQAASALGKARSAGFSDAFARK